MAAKKSGTICFIVFALLNLGDLLSDWLLYHDVSVTEEGLVYGSSDPKVVYALLAFSVIGTILFITETLNCAFATFLNKNHIDINVMSVIMIWFEEIPHLIISIIIMACREKAISYFQLSKACFVLFGVISRFTIAIISCHRDWVKKSSKKKTILNIFIILGLFTMAMMSILVFCLAHTTKDDGYYKFNIPTTLIEGKYDKKQYLKNTGVFINLPSFGCPSGAEWPEKAAKLNWMKLVTIYEIQQQGSVSVNLFVTEMANATTRIEFQRSNHSRECRLINASKYTTKTLSTQCPDRPLPNSRMVVMLQFVFIKPRVGLVFGDVIYNMKVKQNGTCLPAVKLADDLNETTNSTIGTIQYFKVKAHANTTDCHLLTDASNGTGFFCVDDHLISTKEAWRTGYGKCNTGGSRAPHWNSEIHVDC